MRTGHLEVTNEDGTVTPIWVRVDADLDRQAWLTIRLQHRGQPLQQSRSVQSSEPGESLNFCRMSRIVQLSSHSSITVTPLGTLDRSQVTITRHSKTVVKQCECDYEANQRSI